MRLVRYLISSFAILALQCPAWAHNEAEELGHHWEMPVYRGEMLTQILMMACISVIAFGGLLIRDAYLRRRAKQ